MWLAVNIALIAADYFLRSAASVCMQTSMAIVLSISFTVIIALMMMTAACDAKRGWLHITAKHVDISAVNLIGWGCLYE